MRKIEELIEKLRPDGVEYKELGEVCEILDNMRTTVSKKIEKLVSIAIMGKMGFWIL